MEASMEEVVEASMEYSINFHQKRKYSIYKTPRPCRTKYNKVNHKWDTSDSGWLLSV